MKRIKKEFLRSSQRCTILCLNDKFSDLISVKKQILSTDYKQPFVAKVIEFSRNNSDSYFEYKWVNVDLSRKIQTPKGKWINYIECVAYCEYSRKKRYDSQGNLLPKEKRLNVAETKVFFINFNNTIYCIIFTNDDMDLSRIKKLIGPQNIQNLNSSLQMDPSEFNWLFYKYISKQKIGNCLNINGIFGFRGNVLDENNKFSGKSRLISDLLVTKAFLCNDYPLVSIKLDLDFNSIPSYLYINKSLSEELRVQIESGSGDNFLFSSEPAEDKVPIYVFFKVIPFINDNYKKARKKYEIKEKVPFLKNMGIEVIKQIMKRQGISKNEL